MTLIDIAKRNIKHSMNKYLLYIVAMVFSVTIFFTFVSLMYNKQINDSLDMVDKYGPAFRTASVVIVLFLFIFIGYSNTFFLKQRKKEIALYALFGVEKKQIGRLLFIENLITGIVAMIIGIAIGQLFSLVFSMLLIKLIGSTIAASFSFSGKAVFTTLVVFLITIVLNSLHGFYIIYRFKLIELFQASEKGEKVIKPSYFLAFISLSFLAISYWFLLHPLNKDLWSGHATRNFMIILICTLIGSYLFFHSLSGTVFKILKTNKTLYYKWKNLIVFTKVLNRLRSNAVIFTVISVLNSVTLIAFGFGLSLYYNTKENVSNFTPYSYQYHFSDAETDREIMKVLEKDDNHSLLFSGELEYLEMEGNPGNLEHTVSFYYYDERFAVTSQSAYNQNADFLQLPKIPRLEGNETVSVMNNDLISSQDKKSFVNKEISIISNKDERSFTIVDHVSKTLFNYDSLPMFLLVVNDTVYTDFQNGINPVKMKMISISNADDSKELTAKLKGILPDGAVMNSFYGMYKEAMSVYGLLIFIGGFLGLVFLFATGSMIYFKLLIEASEDRERYQIIRKLGVTKTEVRWILIRKNIVFFILPLIMGIAHSSVVLTSISMLMKMSFFIPVVLCVSVYSLLYSFFFLLTIYSSSKNV